MQIKLVVVVLNLKRSETLVRINDFIENVYIVFTQ